MEGHRMTLMRNVPARDRRAGHPQLRSERVWHRTLSTTTRTCNKLHSVNWLTEEVAQWHSTGAR